MLNILSIQLLGKAGAESDLLAEQRPAFGFLSAPTRGQRWKERNNFFFCPLAPSFEALDFFSVIAILKIWGFGIMNSKTAVVFQPCFAPGTGTRVRGAGHPPLLQTTF